jgi:sugar-specific transcriptional regulator TrmB
MPALPGTRSVRRKTRPGIASTKRILYVERDSPALGSVAKPPAMAELDVVDALVALGFSLNESRAYKALLLVSPATGYEVGVRAHVPRSAVYGVLGRLVAVGAARAIAGRPQRFAATPASHVLALLRKRFDGHATALESSLRELDTSPPVPDAFSVRGYGRVLEEAERLVVGAKERLVMSGWPREIDRLVPELRRAEKRRVYMVTFSHAALPKLPGESFSYGLEQGALEQFWKHRLIVVADDILTLIAGVEGTDGDEGVVSETPAIAEVATSQVALDITLLAQRQRRNVRHVMTRMLGHRVGRLDSLLGPRQGDGARSRAAR